MASRESSRNGEHCPSTIGPKTCSWHCSCRHYADGFASEHDLTTFAKTLLGDRFVSGHGFIAYPERSLSKDAVRVENILGFIPYGNFSRAKPPCSAAFIHALPVLSCRVLAYCNG